MKKIGYLNLLLFIFISTCLMSCKSNNEEIGSGVSGQSWLNKEPLEITTEAPLQVVFNAANSWGASSNSSWCKITPTTGDRGQNIIKLTATSTTDKDRTAIISISVKGYSDVSFSVIQKALDPSLTTEDMEVNKAVYDYLSEMYLWNDEYKTLSLDNTKDYQSFFSDALLSMNTNTLDKKLESDGKYYIFSYIEKLNTINSVSSTGSRATKYIDKELAYSFGFTGITPIRVATETGDYVYFSIEGIYPDSPASNAGLKRGTLINKIDGTDISVSNWYTQYTKLMGPANVISVNVTSDGKEVGLTSKAMYCNPILLSKVLTEGTHKIGYLVYSSFDAGFDEELFNVFKDFKSQNITDLILDLRYNGGGHTISANMIATCVAGNYAKDKVFTKYRYNAERMKVLNGIMDEDLFATSTYSNLGVSLSDGFLGLKKIYCIVGNNTASSSELVINSLRGIDIDVVLIGEKTVGKNVGMEYTEKTIRNNKYRIVPITFQSYNAKGFGDYQGGFEPIPSLIIDETNPLNQTNVFYNYRDFGTNNEPLYAKAVELITGVKLSVTSRSYQPTLLKGNTIKVSAKHRLGFDGMLKKAKE